jgi:hypothetical protein
VRHDRDENDLLEALLDLFDTQWQVHYTDTLDDNPVRVAELLESLLEEPPSPPDAVPNP